MKAITSVIALAVASVATPASAATVFTAVNASILNSPFTFSVQNVSFTLSAVNSFASPLRVSNGTGGGYAAVFGNPSPYSTSGTVDFGPSGKVYMSFSDPTQVTNSGGSNFLGIRATVGTDNYYGFVYTVGNVLKGYGFETAANTTITATTAVAAVPEPATWGMMLLGFGMLGAALRYRRRGVTVTFA